MDMGWRQDGTDAQVSADGYRVQAVRHTGRWRYAAWGPEQGDIRQRMQVRYARGAAVPQPRELLGVAESAAEARALCATHRSGPPAAP